MIDEERKIPDDNLFLIRFITAQRKINRRIKMFVNGKQVDIDAFLGEDMRRSRHYNITFK